MWLSLIFFFISLYLTLVIMLYFKLSGARFGSTSLLSYNFTLAI